MNNVLIQITCAQNAKDMPAPRGILKRIVEERMRNKGEEENKKDVQECTILEKMVWCKNRTEWKSIAGGIRRSAEDASKDYVNERLKMSSNRSRSKRAKGYPIGQL